jgi:MoxR-like ATPase
MLDGHGEHDPLDGLRPVSDAAEIRRLIQIVRQVYVSAPVKQYVIDLVTATRHAADLRLGASPRASLHLLRTARAVAALDGREFVLPDDVQTLASPVLSHRLLPTPEVQISRRTTESVVADLVARVPVPDDRGRRGGR